MKIIKIIIGKLVYLLFIIVIVYLMILNINNDDDKNDNTRLVVNTNQSVDDLKNGINNIYDAVVYIEVTLENNYRMGSTTSLISGSGFVYKKDNNYAYIITNYHVVNGGNNIVVTFNNGREVNAEILGSDEYLDIAVLRIDSSNIDMIAKMGSSANVDIGDTLFTVGAPLGKDFMGTITKGILSGKNRIVNIEISSGNFLMDTIQTDASINSGNSGGPLCNINGEVIGVNSSKLVGDGIEGMGFAIPIDRVVEVLSYLEQGKEIIRPYLGIQMTDISTLYDSRNNINIEFNTDIKNGIVITYVEEGKAAYNAGLKKGDIIISVNDELVTDTLYFRYLLYKYNIGDDIKIKYYRNNKLEEVVLKLS